MVCVYPFVLLQLEVYYSSSFGCLSIRYCFEDRCACEAFILVSRFVNVFTADKAVERHGTPIVETVTNR